MTYKKWRDVRAQAVREGRIDEARVAEEKRRLEALLETHKEAEARKEAEGSR